MAILDVLMEGRLAGALELPESGWPRLRYNDTYAQADSATPLSTLFVPERAEHSGEALANWLVGLLPDDDRVLDSMRERYGTHKSRPLDLLSTPLGERMSRVPLSLGAQWRSGLRVLILA